MRSLTLPPGLSSSSLARIAGLTPAATLCRRTNGVFPTRSRMLSEYFSSPHPLGAILVLGSAPLSPTGPNPRSRYAPLDPARRIGRRNGALPPALHFVS